MKNSYAAEGSSMEKQFLSLAVASESSKGPMDELKTSKNLLIVSLLLLLKRKMHDPFKWIQLNGNVKIG